MAPDSLTLAAVAALFGLLALARHYDRLLQGELEGRMSALLSPRGRELMDHLLLGVRENALGVRVGRKAVLLRDEERLRRAVDYIEGFAPSLREGLAAIRAVAHAVSILVDLPPVEPSAFDTPQLRRLTALVRIGHALLVTGSERIRLRVWLVGRALSLCLRWLRRSSERVGRDPAEWVAVERTLTDLSTVGAEAEITYERVVRCFDALARAVAHPAGPRGA